MSRGTADSWRSGRGFNVGHGNLGQQLATPLPERTWDRLKEHALSLGHSLYETEFCKSVQLLVNRRPRYASGDGNLCRCSELRTTEECAGDRQSVLGVEDPF